VRSALSAEQRGVRRGAALAVLSTLLVLAVALLVGRDHAAGAEDPIAFAIRWSLVPMLWLLVAVGAVAQGRFFSADDIAGSGISPPSPKLRIQAAVLQNTFEQSVLAVGAYLGLAASGRAWALAAIPALAFLFSAGRVAFWNGYRSGATGRAFGFGLTFYPTALAYGLAVALALR